MTFFEWFFLAMSWIIAAYIIYAAIFTISVSRILLSPMKRKLFIGLWFVFGLVLFQPFISLLQWTDRAFEIGYFPPPLSGNSTDCFPYANF